MEKSFENSFVFTILPFGSVTVSLRVTFAETGSKCNAVDTDAKIQNQFHIVFKRVLVGTRLWFWINY
jgi:hypothetical protein